MKAGLNEPVLAKYPGEMWQIDLMGPLNETENGNLWALTMFDQFTRWPIAIPLPNTRQETIMEALYAHLICEKSVPKTIVSDRGHKKKFHPKWVYLFKTGVGFFDFASQARTKWLNELVMRCMR
jgi:IS30 family transposase